MDADRDRLVADLSTVLEVSRAMGSERDLDRLLDLIISAVSRLVGADRSSLFLVDRERAELWTSVAQGSTAIRIPLGTGIAGAVAASGETVNIPSAYEDGRFNPENDRRSGYTTRNILCMPLRNHREEVVGVIQTLNKQGGAFTAYDEQVLGALCSQAAVAIDNAQLVMAEKERARLAHELALAARIQSNLLPKTAPERHRWRFAAYSSPCDETGGDYFDYLEQGSTVDAVVGDVTGHGIGAALMMSTARAFLRAVHADGGPAHSVITRLNHLLATDLGDDAFMSLVMLRLEEDGRTVYVSAGHEPPLVWRAATAAFDTYEDTGLLLGVLDDEVYTEVAIKDLAPGDLLVLYTDGLWECEDGSGDQLGLDRFKAAIAVAAPQGAEAVRDAAVAAAQNHLGGRPPLDDMTLVVVEHRA